MKVTFSTHAEGKFRILEELGFKFKVVDIQDALEDPDFRGEGDYPGTEAVHRSITERLNLRVIYSNRGGIIHVITFYPVRKGRYQPKL